MENKECKFNRINDNDYILYECSNCKEWWQFEEGNPEDNMYNYCPCCGYKINEIIELKEE